ncbi:MAG: response regulator [Deltaproteobacteria bacterium]|nr:response regulator [Deltaproteobacteria bacterium]
MQVAVVDDDPAILIALQNIFADAGFAVTVHSTAHPCIAAVARGEVDIIFTDINMPGMTGVELLQAVKGLRPEVEVVIMTADPRVESAVQATRFGAVDYLQKPFDNIDAVAALAQKTARRVLDERRRRQIVKRHQEDTNQGLSLSGQLDRTDLGQVLQVVAELGRDGVLTLDGPPAGAIHVRAGRITGARYGGLAADKALHRMLREARGAYRLAAYATPAGGESMGGAVLNYVLEGMRHKDEFTSTAATLPSLDGPWVFGQQCAAPLSQLNPWMIEIMADVLRAKSARAALDNPSYHDLDLLNALRYLWSIGALKAATPTVDSKLP